MSHVKLWREPEFSGLAGHHDMGPNGDQPRINLGTINLEDRQRRCEDLWCLMPFSISQVHSFNSFVTFFPHARIKNNSWVDMHIHPGKQSECDTFGNLSTGWASKIGFLLFIAYCQMTTLTNAVTEISLAMWRPSPMSDGLVFLWKCQDSIHK